MFVRLLKVLFYSISFFVLLTVIAIFALQTTAGRKLFISSIEKILEQNLGYRVRFEDCSISLPAVLTLNKILVSDATGQFMHIEDICINIDPLLLLGQIMGYKVVISRITMSKMQLERLPIMTTQVSESNIFNINQHPDIVVKSLAIGQFITITNNSEIRQLEINNISAVIKAVTNAGNTIKVKVLSDVPLLDRGRVKALVSYDVKKHILSIPTLELVSEPLKFVANLSSNFDTGHIEAFIKYDSQLSYKPLMKYVSELKASISGSVRLTGQFKHVNVLAEGLIHVDTPQDSKYAFPDLSWQINANVLKHRAYGILETQQAGFKGKGNFKYQNNLFSIENFIANSALSRQTLSLLYSKPNQTLTWSTSFVTKSLKDIAHYLRAPLDGAAKVKLDYTAVRSNKKSSVRFEADCQDFKSQIFRAAKIGVIFDSPDINSFQISTAALNIQDGFAGNIQVKKANFTANSKGESIRITNDLDLVTPQLLSIISEEELQIRPDAVNLYIKQLSGTLDGRIISIAEPLSIRFREKIAMDIPKLCLDDGSFSAHGSFTSDQVALYTQFRNLPTKLLYPFGAPLDTSKITGKVSITGTPHAPKIGAEISLYNIIGNKQNLTGRISARINNSEIDGILYIKNSAPQSIAEQMQIARLKIKLPISLQLWPYNLVIHPDESFKMEYSDKGQCNIMSLLNINAEHKIAGVLRGKLSATGTWNKPNLSGELTLLDGKYNYRGIGLKTKDITAKIIGVAGGLKLENIVMHDYYGEKIRGHGYISLLNQCKYLLKLNLNHASPLNNVSFGGKASGALNLTGDYTSCLIKGDLTIGPFQIYIPEDSGRSIPTLNVSKVQHKDLSTSIGNVKAAFRSTLDINVKTGSKVFILGRGVNAMVHGQVALSGSYSNPEAFGQLSSIRGEYNQFGKRFDILEGELIFNGQIPPFPYLSVWGTHKKESIEVGLRLSGYISDLTPEMFCIPAMSKEDALAILLFDKNIENISALETIHVIDAIAQLSRRTGIAKVFDTSRKILSMDRIDLHEDRQKKYSITLGKYISDKIYIESEHDLERIKRLKAELKLNRTLGLEITSEQFQNRPSNQGIGLHWSFDY